VRAAAWPRCSSGRSGHSGRAITAPSLNLCFPRPTLQLRSAPPGQYACILDLPSDCRGTWPSPFPAGLRLSAIQGRGWRLRAPVRTPGKRIGARGLLAARRFCERQARENLPRARRALAPTRRPRPLFCHATADICKRGLRICYFLILAGGEAVPSSPCPSSSVTAGHGRDRSLPAHPASVPSFPVHSCRPHETADPLFSLPRQPCFLPERSQAHHNAWSPSHARATVI
jgi:hypothetical protein